MTEGASLCLRDSLRNLVVIPGKPAIAGRDPESRRDGGVWIPACPELRIGVGDFTDGFQFQDPGTKTKKTRRSYETLDNFTSSLDLSDAE